ncbi:AAA family ATPase [Citricoccus muralis]|uniref:MinD-like ATPase involved in chromosome partitioning or flagellar assembly n=1 Tax=Citricoccus muralis TaxID=169134 RepID=A0A3D9LE85_9MICC|nr:ATPase [Citricoccus muralis]REE03463.1 MinD-like ATPase involved in chromosome partitioning or flagellar assembly [Citricoccus muralis]
MRKVSVATTIMPGFDHVSGLERLRGPVTVIRRCESLAELISMARTGLADVVLVAGDTDQLTLTFMESLSAGGASSRTAAVVALSEVAAERDRLTGLGIPVASPDLDPEELATLLAETAFQDQQRQRVTPGTGARGRGRRAAQDGADDLTEPEHLTTPARPADDELLAPGTGTDHAQSLSFSVTGAEAVRAGVAAESAGRDGAGRDETDRGDAGPAGPVVQGVPAPDPGDESDTNVPSDRDGEPEPLAPGGVVTEPAAPPRVTAVWGPAGSPGRTTVAVNLAVELALSGRRTLLIDLDTYAASAAIHLGLLDESAGIAQACRTADQGGISPEGVGRAALRARVAGASLQVLTGLTRADRWPELRRAALDDVLAAAAAGWDEVVLDCGFCLEEDEELSFDIPAPQRNAATLAGLAAADRILAVGTGDPVGLPRLIHGLDELGQHVDIVERSRVEVVVNHVRPDASGVAPQSQITGVLERFGGSWTVGGFLPWDRRALDRALLGGQVLAEAAPKSALRRAVARLAGTAAGSLQTGPATAAVGQGLRTLLWRS